jgi:hypothetical protein
VALIAHLRDACDARTAALGRGRRVVDCNIVVVAPRSLRREVARAAQAADLAVMHGGGALLSYAPHLSTEAPPDARSVIDPNEAAESHSASWWLRRWNGLALDVYVVPTARDDDAFAGGAGRGAGARQG